MKDFLFFVGLSILILTLCHSCVPPSDPYRYLNREQIYQLEKMKIEQANRENELIKETELGQ